MVPTHMPRARPKMHLAVLKLSSAPRQPGWKWYHHTRWARDGSLGSTRFWLFANWSCKSKSEVFSRDTEERYSLFSKDGLKASGWSESVFNVFCVTDAKELSPLQLPACYCWNSKTQTSSKIIQTSRKNDAMVYITSKDTSNEVRLEVCNLMLAYYLSPHKWTPGQLSRNVGQ